MLIAKWPPKVREKGRPTEGGVAFVKNVLDLGITIRKGNGGPSPWAAKKTVNDENRIGY